MVDFLETTFEKFIFRVKMDLLYSSEDFWADLRDHMSTIGLTDFLQKSKGDVAFVETVKSGTPVHRDQEIGMIETIKSTFAIISPVTGKVVEVNADLETSPYLINNDPYGAGWIYKIEVTDPENDKVKLLHAESYMEVMKEKIAKGA